MTDQTSDETIIVRYVIEAQDAITKAKEFRMQVDSIKEQLKAMKETSGQSFRDLAIGMQQVAKVNLKQQIDDLKSEGTTAGKVSVETKAAIAEKIAAYNQWRTAATMAIREVNQELQKEGQQTQVSATQVKSSLSSVAIGLASAFGISAINMVRQFFQTIINFMQQAIQAGYEYAKGLYQISVAVSALRRAGTNITFGDVLEQLQKLKSEFGIFATKDLVVGAAAFLNLNRDMGFTEKQLFNLQEAIATLAVVNGRSMDEVQKTVALALSSGYTEGLQRLGVSINRVTIAEEAARLGYAKSYMALTEQQRALATYNLVLQKTAVYAQDLYKYQKTLPGAIDSTTAAITDATAKTGENLLSLKYLWEQAKLAVINYVNSASSLEKKKPTNILDYLPIVSAYHQVIIFADAIQKVLRNWEEIKKAFKESFVTPFTDKLEQVRTAFRRIIDAAKEFAKLEPFNTIIKSITFLYDGLQLLVGELDRVIERYKTLFGILATMSLGVVGQQSLEFANKLKDIFNPPEEQAVEVAIKTIPVLTDEQVDAVNSANKQILDLQEQYNNDRRDLAIDLERDLAQIEADGQDKLEELAASHAQKMLDIANKTTEDINR